MAIRNLSKTNVTPDKTRKTAKASERSGLKLNVDIENLKGMFKKKIYQNSNEAVKGMSNKDITAINNTKKITAIKKEKYEAEKEKADLENLQAIEDIQRKKEKLEAQNELTKTQIANAKNEAMQARLQRAIKFNSEISKNTEKEIPEYRSRAKNYRVCCFVASLISGATSCLGIWFEKGQPNLLPLKENVILISSFVAMICIAIAMNILLNNIATITKKFINAKNKLDKVLICLMYGVVGCCMGYSILTNFIFWNSVNKNRISSAIYSIIFDIVSITFCLMFYKYDELEFSSKYEQEVNKILFGEEEAENEKIDKDLLTVPEENRVENEQQKNEILVLNGTEENANFDSENEKKNIQNCI